jgi:spermidine synthase
VEIDATTAAESVLAPARPRRQMLLLAIFTSATLLSATLLFLVEPMAAKMLLPLYGGSPSVWATSLVFFQAVLLAGYAYAHVSSRLLGPHRQRVVQLVIIAAAAFALPVGNRLSAPPEATAPALWLLAALALSVGAPFFVVTTAGPVLQRWFAATDHPAARDPYFLYAAGSLGSLVGLLAYPTVVEPLLPLDAQADLWTVGYLSFAALSLLCSTLLSRNGMTSAAVPSAGVERTRPDALSWSTRVRWVALAFIPSSLMFGATSHISTDVASIPLLWIAPLAAYLLTFVAAFARRRPISPSTASWLLAVVAAPTVFGLVVTGFLPIVGSVGLDLAIILCAGLLVHGRLADERPQPSRLTEFYLLVSLGGVLGGAFNALLAPFLFDSVIEYPLVIAVALFLRLRPQRRASLRARLGDLALPLLLYTSLLVALVGLAVPAPVAVGAAAAAILLFVRNPTRFAVGAALVLTLTLAGQPTLYQERTFFGVLRVVETPEGRHELIHGTTIHGAQDLRSGHSTTPLTYYHPAGPAGDLFRALQRPRPFRHVSVIGLGVGSLAAYGRPGQTFTFYEIDPEVVKIASNPRLFTFLRQARADVRVVVGDGRRTIGREQPGRDDLIVVDAFSSDSIPMHLLTREALVLYLQKLSPRGVVAFHVSNRHLDLRPVLAAAATDLGLAALELQRSPTPRATAEGAQASRWVALAPKASALVPLARAGWKPLPSSDGPLWTDRYSNLLTLLI